QLGCGAAAAQTQQQEAVAHQREEFSSLARNDYGFHGFRSQGEGLFGRLELMLAAVATTDNAARPAASSGQWAPSGHSHVFRHIPWFAWTLHSSPDRLQSMKRRGGSISRTLTKSLSLPRVVWGFRSCSNTTHWNRPRRSFASIRIS